MMKKFPKKRLLVKKHHSSKYVSSLHFYLYFLILSWNFFPAIFHSLTKLLLLYKNAPHWRFFKVLSLNFF